MIRGLTVFLALTAAGLAALWHFTAQGDAPLAEGEWSRQVVANLSVGFLALAVLCAVADVLIGAMRYQIFLRRIRPGTSLWLPIRADLANRFVGAVTPSQTGGGPAQVFVLWRGGIPIPDALAFLLVNFLSTLVFFLVAGGVAVWIFRERFPAGGIHALVQYAFVAFAGCLLAMLVGLVRPDWLARPLTWGAARLEGRLGPASRIARRGCLVLSRSLERYRAACAQFIRENPGLPVLSFVLTLLLYLNKFTLAWLVMRGLGVEGDYGTTLAVQAFLHFILFVAPTPGGSGIAEIGTGALMAILMPAHLLAPFTLAYRLLLIYLPAGFGALVLLEELHPARLRREPLPAPPGAGARESAGVVKVRKAAVAAGAAMLLFAGPVGAQLASVARAAPPAPITNFGERKGNDDAGVRIETLVGRGLLAPDPDSKRALFQKSVGLARGLVRDRPTDAEAHFLLSVALGYLLEHEGLRTKLRMAGEVRAEAERALELDPRHAGAHHVMGRLHAGAMRLNRVARLALRGILGASAFEGASWERAEEHFREAWRNDPASPRHPMELGALYVDTGRPGLAREVLAEAIRLTSRGASDSLAVVRARTLLAGLEPE